MIRSTCVTGFLVLLALIGASSPARSQCHSWQSGYVGSAAPNSTVYATCTFDDGSGLALYAGGHFSNAGGGVAPRIARWDDSTWSALGSGMNGDVRALVAFDDGSGPALYAGGAFTTAGGSPASYIARWNGSSWSPVGGGMNNPVFALAVYDDGTGPALYAGGGFSNAGGNLVNFIAKWNGSTWSALGSGLNSGVLSLAVHHDGNRLKLYAGGSFTSAGGQSASNIAAWNGTFWAALEQGVNGPVEEMISFTELSGTSLFVGGDFTQAGGQSSQYVAKWLGGAWIPAGAGVLDETLSFASFDDGGGPVLYRGGTAELLRWNGSQWTKNPAEIGTFHALLAADLGSGTTLYAAGNSFYPVAGNIVGFRDDLWRPLGGNVPFGEVGAMTAFDDGSGPKLFVGGDFEFCGSTPARYVASWDGSHWSALGTGLGSVWIGRVEALCVFDDGAGPDLYVAGNFVMAGGIPVPGIARWDGANWSSLGDGVSGIPRSMVSFDDGTGPALYVAAAQDVARWDGSSWSSLGSGWNGNVEALGIFDDGTGPALYATGTFQIAGGVSASKIAKWNGSVWSPLGSGLNASGGSALASFDDGTGPALYVGGQFTMAGGVSTEFIARWNGSTWSAVGTGMFNVLSLLVHDDGSGTGPLLYAGGYGWGGAGQTVDSLARWDGTSWSELGGGPYNVYAMGSFDDGVGPGPDLFASGSFTSVTNGTTEVVSSGFAQWNGCGRPGVSFCPGDGTVAACPCGNSGTTGRGCQNSASTGGALLYSSGWTSLANDTLGLTSTGELPTPLSIFLQGNSQIAPVTYGDGLRCTGGSLKRLFVKNASDGTVQAPGAGDPSVSERSAQKGDTIPVGGTRFYQVYYRDPSATFCPNPTGNTWNVSNAVRIGWLL